MGGDGGLWNFAVGLALVAAIIAVLALIAYNLAAVLTPR